MAPNQAVSTGLQVALADAVADYRASWQTVDGELYSLCRRRPGQRSFADVYAKVAIIGRVYEAGIARSSRASGDREALVAQGITELADLIEASLRDLSGRPFDRAVAAQIVELHGRVARGLRPHAGNRWLTSFVSKYLHFHCNIVPIYDTRAQDAIGGWVHWPTVAEVRVSMAEVPDWARAYRNFVAAFVVLHERIRAEIPVPASVKDIDHLLWRSA